MRREYKTVTLKDEWSESQQRVHKQLITFLFSGKHEYDSFQSRTLVGNGDLIECGSSLLLTAAPSIHTYLHISVFEADFGTLLSRHASWQQKTHKSFYLMLDFGQLWARVYSVVQRINGQRINEELGSEYPACYSFRYLLTVTCTQISKEQWYLTWNTAEVR